MCSKFPSRNLIGDLFFFLIFVSHIFCDFCWWWTCFDKFSKSNHCFIEITSRTWKFFATSCTGKKCFSQSIERNPNKNAAYEIINFLFPLSSLQVFKHFRNNHKLSILRCLVLLTIIAFVYKTAIQLAARFTCYGYHIIFCVEFAPI